MKLEDIKINQRVMWNKSIGTIISYDGSTCEIKWDKLSPNIYRVEQICQYCVLYTPDDLS